MTRSEIVKALWQDPEYRRRHIVAVRRFTRDPAYRSQQSKTTKRTWENPAVRAKHIAGSNRPENLTKQSAHSKATWRDPEIRARRMKGIEAAKDKVGAASKRSWRDPVHRARRLAALSDPKLRARRSATAKALWLDPKIRAKRLAVWDDPAYRAKHAATVKKLLRDPARRTKHVHGLAVANERRRVPAEIALKTILRRLHIKFKSQEVISGLIADISLVRHKTLVEVDGPYHYRSLVTQRKDRLKNRIWRAAGYQVLRIRNKDVFKHPDKVAKLLQAFV